MARNTGGVSPYLLFQSLNDWALHITRSPGRQLKLAERAMRNAMQVAALAVQPKESSQDDLPFEPLSYDYRFTHTNWTKMPFVVWQQSFLATQDCWNHAKGDLRGLSEDDAARVRFMVRQALDLVSPSNLPLTNPEIIEKKLSTQHSALSTQHSGCEYRGRCAQPRRRYLVLDLGSSMSYPVAR